MLYLQHCRFGIAILTEAPDTPINLNVMLEIGYLDSRGVPVCILTPTTSTLPADLTGRQYIKVDVERLNAGDENESARVVRDIDRWLEDNCIGGQQVRLGYDLTSDFTSDTIESTIRPCLEQIARACDGHFTYVRWTTEADRLEVHIRAGRSFVEYVQQLVASGEMERWRGIRPIRTIDVDTSVTSAIHVMSGHIELCQGSLFAGLEDLNALGTTVVRGDTCDIAKMRIFVTDQGSWWYFHSNYRPWTHPYTRKARSQRPVSLSEIFGALAKWEACDALRDDSLRPLHLDQVTYIIDTKLKTNYGRPAIDCCGANNIEWFSRTA